MLSDFDPGLACWAHQPAVAPRYAFARTVGLDEVLIGVPHAIYTLFEFQPTSLSRSPLLRARSHTHMLECRCHRDHSRGHAGHAAACICRAYMG